MNKKVEELFRKEVDAEAPNDFDYILKQCDLKAEDGEPLTEETGNETKGSGNIFFRRKVIGFACAGIAAAILIIALILGPGRQQRPEMQQVAVTETGSQAETTTVKSTETNETTTETDIPVKKTYARVCLDVNPSVELQIDEKNNVTGCEDINEDAEDILKDITYEGESVTAVTKSIVNKLYSAGYFSKENDSLLLSVVSADTEKGSKLRDSLVSEVKTILNTEKNTNVNIVGQCIAPDDELDGFAKSNKLSVGRAWLIKKLNAAVDVVDEDSLLNMSTQELLRLCMDSVDADSDESLIYDRADTGAIITPDAAVSIALSYIGSDGTDVVSTEATLVNEGSAPEYIVMIYSTETTFTVYVDAITGEVLAAPANAEEGATNTAESETTAAEGDGAESPTEGTPVDVTGEEDTTMPTEAETSQTEAPTSVAPEETTAYIEPTTEVPPTEAPTEATQPATTEAPTTPAATEEATTAPS